jgi:hypothetical protein
MLSHRLIISSLSPSNLALSCIGFVAAGPSFCPVILNEKFEGIKLKPVVYEFKKGNDDWQEHIRAQWC